MSGETWKDIPGYEGLYQVSDMGRVRSLDREVEGLSRWGGMRVFRKKGRLMSLGSNGHGYQMVHLKDKGVRRSVSVHRLVATAFIPNPDSLSQVNHLDSDQTNNRVGNLEWTDAKGNIRHGILQGAIDLRKDMRPVLGVSLADPSSSVVFESQAAAEEALSRNRRRTGAVSCCLLGKVKHSYGYVWVAL